MVWPRVAWEPLAEAQRPLHTQVGSWHLLGDSGADEGDLAERAGIRLCTCKCSDLVQGKVFAEPQPLGILWFLHLSLDLAYLWNHTLRAWS